MLQISFPVSGSVQLSCQSYLKAWAMAGPKLHGGSVVLHLDPCYDTISSPLVTVCALYYHYREEEHSGKEALTGRACLHLTVLCTLQPRIQEGGALISFAGTSGCLLPNMQPIKSMTNDRRAAQDLKETFCTVCRLGSDTYLVSTSLVLLLPDVLTFEPPANTKCRALQTNIPPFSTSFLQCRKAKLR